MAADERGDGTRVVCRRNRASTRQAACSCALERPWSASSLLRRWKMLWLSAVAVLLLPSGPRSLAQALATTPSLAADATQFLDGEAWVVSGGSAAHTISCPGSVPGDLITDLERAGLIGDPLYELNFLSPLWDASNFSYSTTFVLEPGVAAQQQLLLALDGVKMVADISLNNHSLGYVDNAFLRFTYPLR